MKSGFLFVIGGIVVIALLWSGRSPIAFREEHGPTVSESSMVTPTKNPVSSPRDLSVAAGAVGDDLIHQETKLAQKNTATLVAQLRAALSSFSTADLDRALSQLLPALLEQDPAAAAEFAESLVEPSLRAEVLHLVARHWGARDPQRAMAWAGGLKNEIEREAALTESSARLAQIDPAQAVARAAPAFRVDQPSAALEMLTQRWAEANFTDALEWTRAQSQGAQRDGLLARLALVESQASPAVAARLVAEEITPGEAQDEAALSVVHQWARRDPAAALAWVERFSRSEFRGRALTELDVAARQRFALPPR